jgi:hypothetical protein
VTLRHKYVVSAPAIREYESVTLGANDGVWQKLGEALDRAHAGSGAYPVLATAHPVFLAVEQAGIRWRVLGSASPTPQEARDELAHQFLMRAAQAEPESPVQKSYRKAADLLDRERHDEIRAGGGYFRVARIEQVVRRGPNGPEPPRPADTSRSPHGKASSSEEFLDEVGRDLGLEAMALKADVANAVTKAGALPPENIADEQRGHQAYPDAVLLGTWFTIGEQVEGDWKAFTVTEYRTPAGARISLLRYFRDYVPRFEQPGPDACAAYALAADTMERDQLDEITANGRRFRITRVERLARMRGGLPEPPRPSDFDPYPPPAA